MVPCPKMIVEKSTVVALQVQRAPAAMDNEVAPSGGLTSKRGKFSRESTW